MRRTIGQQGKPRKRVRTTTTTTVARRSIPRRRFTRPFYRQRGYLRTGGVFGRFGGATPELKFIDCKQANLAMTATGTIFPQAASALTYGPAAGSAPSTGSFCTIVQGDQEYQRVGRQITIKKILCRGIFVLANATPAETVRLLLIQDMQANGAVPTVNTAIGFTGKAVEIVDFNNIENSKRFKVLYDKQVDVNALTALAASANTRQLQFKFFLKCNIPIDYDSTATTGAIATIRSNNLFMIGLSTTGTCILTFQLRLRYIDT